MQQTANEKLAFQTLFEHLTSNATHELQSNLWAAYSQENILHSPEKRKGENHERKIRADQGKGHARD